MPRYLKDDGSSEVAAIIDYLKEYITDCFLVSAYDFGNDLLPKNISFSEYLFLDSGGYECSKDADLSDLGYQGRQPDSSWSFDRYIKVLDEWHFPAHTVAVSYDNPNEQRISVADQFYRAKSIFDGRFFGKEILIKAEDGCEYIKVESIVNNIHELRSFDVLGLTEKELGCSLLDRMRNISIIRRGMKDAGINKPIHIFGSLDMISTLHYFVVGADIFDGLTWLRFAYLDGQSVYIDSYMSQKIGCDIKDCLVRPIVWRDNLFTLKRLENDMRRFLKEGDFSCFKHHGDLLKKAYQETMAILD